MRSRVFSEAAFTVGVLTLRDGAGVEELPRILDQASSRLDILMLLGCRFFARDGQAQRYRVEAAVAPFGPSRSFLSPSTRGPLHAMILLNHGLFQPITHHTPGGAGVSADEVGALTVTTDGLDRPLILTTVQWPNESGDARLNQARQLTRYAAPGTAAIIGGGLGVWPDRPRHRLLPWRRHRGHVLGRQVLPARKRRRQSPPPGLRPPGHPGRSRGATEVLAEAGFISAGCAADDMTPTTNVDGGQGGRIDHILLAPHLASALLPDTYQVWPDTIVGHRLITATLDLLELDEPEGL